MAIKGQPPLNLSESQIKYALENTNSIRQAAAWLHVNYLTFKKYARLYIDPITGKSLFALHLSDKAKKAWETRLNPQLKDPTSKVRPMKMWKKATLEDIFAGKHPNYSRKILVQRMINDGLIAECCSHCGYNTRREVDFKIPLKLWFHNHDPKDLTQNNIRLLCFNCYFLIANPNYAHISELEGDNLPKAGF